ASGAKLLDQQSPRAMKPRSNSANRAADYGGCINVAQLMQIAEHDNFPVARRHGQNRLTKLLDHLIASQIVERVASIDHCAGRLFFFLRRTRELNKHPVLLEPSQNIIARDAVEVRRQRASAWIVSVCFANQHDEYFLSH